MALLFGASTDLGSSRQTSRIIGPILRWIKPDITPETVQIVLVIARKGAHVGGYAVLAILVWWAVRKPVRNDPRPWRWDQALLAWGAATAYGAMDELHQIFVASRDGKFHDVLLDSSGAAFGLALIWMIGRWRKRW
jgi:VanZ family protein